MSSSAAKFGKNPERVAAGLKAVVHNPNMTAEARNNASERLREMGVDPEEPLSARKAHELQESMGGQGVGKSASVEERAGGSGASGDIHEHHVLGGYKATLKNPKSSAQAKHHAEEVLEKEETHEHHILGGYKATLKNPNASAEAKLHAEKVLESHSKHE